MNNGSRKKSEELFSLKKRVKSFRFAFQGLITLWQEEHNSRIHLVTTLLVVFAACIFKVSTLEWCILIIAIALVFAAECFNSALENLADHITTEVHPLIKKSKDLSAAAVLICAVGAAVVGLIVFLPYVLRLF